MRGSLPLVIVGGLTVSAGTIGWLTTLGTALSGLVWVSGAIVAAGRANTWDQGAENAAFATLLSIMAVIAFLFVEGSGTTSIADGLLVVIILLPFVKIFLAIPLVTVGAVVGAVRGRLVSG